MLKKRILTAIFLISIVVATIFYANALIQAGVILAVCLLAGYEWLRLINAKIVQKILFYVALVFCAVLFYCIPSFADAALWVSLIGWLFAFFAIIAYQRERLMWPSNLWINTLIGLWLIVPMWAGLFLLLEFNGLLALLLLILVWSSDIFAYFAGRKWGRHLLASRVSPGKSWEGVVGAVLGTAIVIYFMIPLGPLFFIALAMIPVSIIGDLFESMVKRIYGVKDSGQLLPGHGGVLDRLDSLTAAAPLFAWACFFLILEI